MRRPVVLVSTLALLVAVLVAVPGPSASAADPIRGRLVDLTTGAAVRGATMVLRELGEGGGLGERVARVTTTSDGRFSLDPGASGAEEFYVVLQSGRYQGGAVGGDPRAVQPSVEFAGTVARGTRLGDVGANPAYIRGRVVDARTGKPVRRAPVTARVSPRNGVVVARDTTDRRGRFVVRPIACEGECVLHVNGRSLGYERGFRACNARIVPTVGQACGSPIGRIGSVFLDRERSPAREAAAPSGRLVKPGQVGKTKVGMTVAAAMATGEFNKNVANPPCDPIKLQPKKPYKRQYSVFVAARRVVEMNVGGTRPVTAAGVRVGSTYRQLRQAYPGRLTAPEEVGFGQWGVYLRTGPKGPDRKWLGFLFGKAFVDDGPLRRRQPVTLLGVTKGSKPPLILDGC